MIRSRFLVSAELSSMINPMFPLHHSHSPILWLSKDERTMIFLSNKPITLWLNIIGRTRHSITKSRSKLLNTKIIIMDYETLL